VFEFRPTIAQEVASFDYTSNPAAKRGVAPPTASDAQRRLWQLGAERNGSGSVAVNRKAFRRTKGHPQAL